jgi:predicted enzyme related to lactoylglutathione lyase
MINHIKLINIPVRDQARALDFYTEKLGFTIITDQPMDKKQRWIELRIPKAETRLSLFTPPGHEERVGSFTGISFDCDNIEATYTELSARGVPFEGPPKKESWGVFAMFKDSEGNSFVLSSSKG